MKGLPTFLWQRATTITEGQFTEYTLKNDKKWYTYTLKWLCDFYSIYTTDKCGCGSQVGDQCPTLQIQHYAKGKSKVHPTTGHEGPEGEYRYSFTLSLNSALDGGGWSMPCPSRLPLGKRPGTYCIGGWVGAGANLEGCRKFCHHRNSIPGPSSP
jgi:hypothetical protein